MESQRNKLVPVTTYVITAINSGSLTILWFFFLLKLMTKKSAFPVTEKPESAKTPVLNTFPWQKTY